MLDLGHGSIADVPPEIGELHRLQYLYLSENGYSSLPSSSFRTEKSRVILMQRIIEATAIPAWFPEMEKWKKSVFIITGQRDCLLSAG